MVEPEPAPDERRVLAGRERRGDEDRRRAVLPQATAQLLGDVDRRPRERVGLGPDDPLEPRLEARLDLARGAERAARQRVEILGLPVQRRREIAERVDEDERRLDGHLAQPPPAGRWSDRAQQPLAGPLDAVELARGQRTLRLAARALDVVREPPQPLPRDAAAEPGRRRLLEPVRLVEDDRVVLGQHARRRRRRARSRARG